MKTFGISALVAGGLTAVVLGLATPAQADYGHNQWINDMGGSSVSVPHVDHSVHH